MTLAAIGTGLQVASSIGKGIAGFNAGRYRAAVAKRNAEIAEQNARLALQRGQDDQFEQDMMARLLFGEQEAAQGGSGLSFGSRSFALTRGSSRQLAARDRERVRRGAEREAGNFRQQAADFKSEAGFERRSARGSLIQGFLGGGSSLISGASKTRNRRRYTGLAQ